MLRMGKKGFRIIFLDDHAFIHKNHPVGNGFGKSHLMGHNKDGHSARAIRLMAQGRGATPYAVYKCPGYKQGYDFETAGQNQYCQYRIKRCIKQIGLKPPNKSHLCNRGFYFLYLI